MRLKLIMVMLSLAFFANGQKLSFPTWNMASPGSVFTVNEFSCITIDKAGRVWAGSTLGGLYYYNGVTWKKFADPTTQDLTFSDIMPSNMPGNNGIWAASIGNLNQATSGGVFYINPDVFDYATFEFAIKRYGTGVFGGLSSRLANSLAMNNGDIYVGLDRQNTTNEGGVFRMSMLNPPQPTNTSFTKVNNDAGPGIIYKVLGTRGNETWFGKNNYCSGTCAAGRIFRYGNSGSFITPSIMASTSPIPFSTSAGTTNVRAIFTDPVTNFTYVGLSAGAGIAVRNANELTWDASNWTMITHTNSPLPENTIVNFNAITKVAGEIWIGTNKGILIYDGCGPLNNYFSYKMLTTENGLPSDNITDLAFDADNSLVWLTSPAGVSSTKYPLTIQGNVNDVFVLKEKVLEDKPISLFETVKMSPIQSNIAIRLFRGAINIETITKPTVCGRFEFKEPKDGENYSVVIEYITDIGELINLEYRDVTNHTSLGDILVPGKLISEIKAFKPNMKSRNFKMNFPDIMNYIKEFDGFKVDNYDQAYGRYIPPVRISNPEKKNIDNLASFLAASGSVYKMGGYYEELVNESLRPLAEFVKAKTDLSKSIKILKSKNVSELLKRTGGRYLYERALVIAFKALSYGLEIIKSSFTKEEDLLYMEAIIANWESVQTYLTSLANGNNDDMKTHLLSKAIDAFSSIVAGAAYSKYYCDIEHKNFVDQTSILAFNAGSSQTYEASFQKLTTLEQSATNVHNQAKTSINTYRAYAKTSSLLADGNLLLAFSTAAIPVAQAAAPIFTALSGGYTALQMADLSTASFHAILGAIQIKDISLDIVKQIPSGSPAIQSIARNSVYQQILSLEDLVSRKNNLKVKLQELKAVFNAPTYDSIQFYDRYLAMYEVDSVYNHELELALNKFASTIDSARMVIPGFSAKYEYFMNNYVMAKQNMGEAFFLQSVAYDLDNVKTSLVPRLNVLADSVMLIADSTVAMLGRLSDSVSAYGIVSQAYMVQSGYELNHSHVIGEAGNVSHTFKNFGGQPMTNVSFKIMPPDGGYSIISKDSFYVGTINPGEEKTISFSFSTPMVDSSGNYIIRVYASNGLFRDGAGLLVSYDPAKTYSIVDGNWSNPNIWSTGIVPNATSIVQIGHAVTVDVDAQCKFLYNSGISKVIVSEGKKLDILN